MSVPKFFEKMIGLQTQKQQQKFLSYRSIVVDIASGGEPSPADVERILAENGHVNRGPAAGCRAAGAPNLAEGLGRNNSEVREGIRPRTFRSFAI